MNKSVMLATVVLFSASAGCAATAEAPAEVDPEVTCGPRTVTVFHGAAFLSAYPVYIDVCRGEEVRINLVPRVGAGKARTEPEGRDADRRGWLRGETDQRGRILIGVPGDADLDVYKYSITVDGVGTLDPSVRVVR